MRILQVIDSLEGGGAERMAVNFANAFASAGDASFLICTRSSGPLLQTLDSKVSYLCLNKRSTFDLKAFYKLYKFIKTNNISIVQAHGSTFFMGIIMKLCLLKFKLFWHDHNGNRPSLNHSINKYIIWFSYLFDGVLCVNHNLEAWSKKHLHVKKIYYMPNFTSINKVEQQLTFLKGEMHKRILCVANLRAPKNHLNLLKAFNASNVKLQGWSLHFVGNQYDDSYFHDIENYITKFTLSDSVFTYGSCTDIFHIMGQADIGCLVSTYEGFPVTILEYGLSNLAVIGSNVGYITTILEEDRGILVDPLDVSGISSSLLHLISDPELKINYAQKLNVFVHNNYSEKNVLQKLKNILND